MQKGLSYKRRHSDYAAKIGSNKSIKEFTQREKFKSYQLNLNKKETAILLSKMPTWDNGTPLVLSFLKK